MEVGLQWFQTAIPFVWDLQGGSIRCYCAVSLICRAPVTRWISPLWQR